MFTRGRIEIDKGWQGRGDSPCGLASMGAGLARSEDAAYPGLHNHSWRGDGVSRDDLIDHGFVNEDPEIARLWVLKEERLFWVDFYASETLSDGLEDMKQPFWHGLLEYAEDKIASVWNLPDRLPRN